MTLFGNEEDFCSPICLFFFIRDVQATSGSTILQVLTSILLFHRRNCDGSQGSRLRENTEAT